MPLRDLLLASIFVLVLPFAFRHAYIGVLLWTWVSVMNPHKLAFGFMHNAPIAAIIGGAVLVSLFFTRDRVKLPGGAPIVFIALFVLWTCITTYFAYFPGPSAEQLVKVLKIQVMVFVTAAVLYKWEHIRWFLWVNVLSLGFYGLKGGIYTIQTGGGGRVWGPPGGFIEGNNELALALIISIPLMHFLRLTTPHLWVKRILLAMMVLTVVSALGTQSRGALLAIIAMGGVLWWRAPNKLVNAVIIGTLAASVWAFMPESWYTRMHTIETYEDDGSAMGRIFAWQTAVNVANDHVTGAGFEMSVRSIFNVYAPDRGDSRFDSKIARAAHSIYFQVLGEHGYIGLFLFVMIWVSAWRVAAGLRRNSRDDPDIGWLYHFGGMAQVALVGWAAGGAFLSLAYFDFPYNLVIALVVAKRWRRERETMPEVRAPMPSGEMARRTTGQRVLGWVRTA